MTVNSIYRTSLADRVIQTADTQDVRLLELSNENTRLTNLAEDYQQKNEELMGSKLAKRLENWRIKYYQANKEKEKLNAKLTKVCGRKRNRFAAPECWGYR